MKKKTANSASKNKQKPPNRRRRSPESISRMLNDLLKQATGRPPGPYELAFLNYEQARDFTHQFIDTLLHAFQDQAEAYEVERMQIATKEVLMETLREKYKMPTMQAAVLMLHGGIEMLEWCDSHKDDPEV